MVIKPFFIKSGKFETEMAVEEQFFKFWQVICTPAYLFSFRFDSKVVYKGMKGRKFEPESIEGYKGSEVVIILQQRPLSSTSAWNMKKILYS